MNEDLGDHDPANTGAASKTGDLRNAFWRNCRSNLMHIRKSYPLHLDSKKRIWLASLSGNGSPITMP